jgi:hypothetical protein
MAKSISQRVRADRGPAGCLATVVTLPALAIMAGMLWLFVSSLEHREETADIVFSGVILLFALMFWLVAGWSYSAARSAMTPQRVQAMWLRRFQSEKGDAFRPSRVIDRLSRYGISAITLQDRDVKLSLEQRRNRLAPTFWFFFVPLSILIGVTGHTQYQRVQTEMASRQIDYSDNIGEAIGQAIGQALVSALAVVFVILLFVAALMATTVLIFALAALAGPFGAFFSRNRDDFRQLPRLLERIKKGKGRRGASIVRISDANWREAVTASLAAVDVAIIDLSQMSEHVAWEIAEAVKAVGPAGLVFICAAENGLSEGARASVRRVLGRDPAHVVFYPARRGGEAKRFARELRERIYEAADLRATARS